MAANAEAVTEANREANTPSISYLGDSAQIGMSFSFMEYSYNPDAGLIEGSAASNFTRNFATADIGASKTVVFPLPKQLVDSVNLNVAGKDLGVTGALAAGISSTAGPNTFSEVGNAARGAITGLRNAARNMGASLAGGDTTFGDYVAGALSGANYMTRAGLASLAPQITAGIEAGLGETVNPHQTLTFDGVALKQHTFSFDFAPRTDKESKYIAQAIHRMKGWALPTYEAVGGIGNESLADFGQGVLRRGLLKYPKLCKVEFVSGGLDSAFFYRMKPAMISSITVDYTPQGNSLLRGGRPAFINVSITLVEQAIHTSGDYGALNFSGVGVED